MNKGISIAKKRILISIAAIMIILFVVAGYYIFQLFVVRKLTVLSVPTLAYPAQSVIYRYSIQSNGLEAIFGGQTMPASQVTTELISDMKNIKSIGFDGIKLTYTFHAIII